MNGENFIEKQLHKINKKFKEARDKFKVKFKDGRTKRYAPKSQKEEDKVITGAMMLGADWDIIKPGSSEYNKKEKANYSNITWKEKLENLKEANWSVLAQKDDSGRVLKDLNVHFQAKDDKEAEEIVKINFPKSKIIKINKDLHKVIIKESFKEQSRTCFNCGKLTSELMYRWYHGDQDDLVCADCAKKLKHSDTNLSGKSVYDVNNKESFKEKLKNLKKRLNNLKETYLYHIGQPVYYQGKKAIVADMENGRYYLWDITGKKALPGVSDTGAKDSEMSTRNKKESFKKSLDHDQTDVLEGVVVSNKNKPNEYILELLKDDNLFKGISDEDLLYYIQDTKATYKLESFKEKLNNFKEDWKKIKDTRKNLDKSPAPGKEISRYTYEIWVGGKTHLKLIGDYNPHTKNTTYLLEINYDRFNSSSRTFHQNFGNRNGAMRYIKKIMSSQKSNKENIQERKNLIWKEKLNNLKESHIVKKGSYKGLNYEIKELENNEKPTSKDTGFQIFIKNRWIKTTASLLGAINEMEDYINKNYKVLKNLKESFKIGDKVHCPSGYCKVINIKGNKIIVRGNNPSGDFEYDLKQIHKESYKESNISAEIKDFIKKRYFSNREDEEDTAHDLAVTYDIDDEEARNIVNKIIKESFKEKLENLKESFENPGVPKNDGTGPNPNCSKKEEFLTLDEVSYKSFGKNFKDLTEEEEKECNLIYSDFANKESYKEKLENLKENDEAKIKSMGLGCYKKGNIIICLDGDNRVFYHAKTGVILKKYGNKYYTKNKIIYDEIGNKITNKESIEITKEDIIKSFIKGGANKSAATKMTNKHYDDVMRIYKGQNLSVKKASELIQNFSLKESYKEKLENLKEKIENEDTLKILKKVAQKHNLKTKTDWRGTEIIMPNNYTVSITQKQQLGGNKGVMGGSSYNNVNSFNIVYGATVQYNNLKLKELEHLLDKFIIEELRNLEMTKKFANKESYKEKLENLKEFNSSIWKKDNKGIFKSGKWTMWLAVNNNIILSHPEHKNNEIIYKGKSSKDSGKMLQNALNCKPEDVFHPGWSWKYDNKKEFY